MYEWATKQHYFRVRVWFELKRAELLSLSQHHISIHSLLVPFYALVVCHCARDNFDRTFHCVSFDINKFMLSSLHAFRKQSAPMWATMTTVDNNNNNYRQRQCSALTSKWGLPSGQFSFAILFLFFSVSFLPSFSLHRCSKQTLLFFYSFHFAHSRRRRRNQLLTVISDSSW